jgi:glycosyltransferase involved in cell wall biosynthesis
MPTRPRVLFVVTEDWYFWSHRLGLAQRALNAGYEVTLSTRIGSYRAQIEALDIRCWPLPFERSLRHPWRDLYCVFALYKLIRKIRPSVVHLVSLKPILLSAVAVVLAPRVQFVHAVTGLGYLFTSKASKARGVRSVLLVLLRWLLRRKNSALLVQNKDDLEELRRHRIGEPARTRLIAGSGVDTLAYFPALALEEATPLVVMPARMLRDKGVFEFIAAAKLVLSAGRVANFALVGGLDPDNPAAITRDEIETLLVPGIEWWGSRSDMLEVYQRSAMVCLPSHREGLPKVLLEAAACGRALIATDVPGCREICRDQVTGILVSPRDSQRLAVAIIELLSDPARRNQLGMTARKICEEEFSIERIANETLQFYDRLLARSLNASSAQGSS